MSADLNQIVQMRQRLLNLPKLRDADWYKYLDDFFNLIRASDVGELMNQSYPELIRALATYSMQGMPLERIAGLLQGIALMQMLHHAGMLKIEQPPLIQKPDVM